MKTSMISDDGLVSTAFAFEVDYCRTLEQMIEAGLYDWSNIDITSEQFPFQGEGIARFQARLFAFNHFISSKEVVEVMKGESFMASGIEHLLAFGEKHPVEQLKHPVVALGSVANGCDNEPVVANLWHNKGRRGLGLYFAQGEWSPRYRFLGVRAAALGL